MHHHMERLVVQVVIVTSQLALLLGEALLVSVTVAIDIFKATAKLTE